MLASTSHSAAAYLHTLRRGLFEIDAEAVEQYATLLYQALLDDRQVFVFGNGGSAATAAHHVADYAKSAAVPGRRRLRAVCLNDNAPLLTAVANDHDYADVFQHALSIYARPGDVAVAISASGNSANIVKACRWAREHELIVAAITGFTGGRAGDLADVHIHIPSDNYGIIEDAQLSIGHIAAQTMQHRLQVHDLAA